MLNLFNTLRTCRALPTKISLSGLRFSGSTPVQILQTSLLIKKAMEAKQGILYCAFRMHTAELYSERRRMPLNAGLIQYKVKQLGLIKDDMRLNKNQYKIQKTHQKEEIFLFYQKCAAWHKLHVLSFDSDQLLNRSEFEDSNRKDLQLYDIFLRHFQEAMYCLSIQKNECPELQGLAQSLESFTCGLDCVPHNKVLSPFSFGV